MPEPGDDMAFCKTCAAVMDWALCWRCDGLGSWHDCGEDVCCCLDPDTQDRQGCPECEGRGEFMFCPAVDEHPHRPTTRPDREG